MIVLVVVSGSVDRRDLRMRERGEVGFHTGKMKRIGIGDKKGKLLGLHPTVEWDEGSTHPSSQVVRRSREERASRQDVNIITGLNYKKSDRSTGSGCRGPPLD